MPVEKMSGPAACRSSEAKGWRTPRWLHRAWVNFDAQLTEHHEGEHEIAWPALAAIGITEPIIASFDTEHEQMAADLSATRLAMATLRRTATRADAHVAATAMARMGRRFGRRVGPARAGILFAWIQDGATEQEKSALAANVPRPVLALIRGVFGRHYRKDVAPVWSD